MNILQWANGPHSAYDECLMAEDELALLISTCTGKRVLEIGSYRGGSAKRIAPVCTKLVCMDIWEDYEWMGEKVKGEDVFQHFCQNIHPFQSKVTVYRANSCSQDSWEHLPTQKFDVVFIDGDHSYQGALNDITKAMKYIQPKTILVHDYCYLFSGVIAACTNFFQRYPDQLHNTLARFDL